MESLVIQGGRRLEGSLQVDGAKNAALPILAACVLTAEAVHLRDVPDILDVRRMADILRMLGCLVVIALFAALMIAGYRVAVACRDKFGALLAAGITSSITVQAFLNMGVVVGILPTTGLPLPFFSAGGTSISITMAAMGILMNISRNAGKMDC